LERGESEAAEGRGGGWGGGGGGGGGGEVLEPEVSSLSSWINVAGKEK